jgi:hypothetical protein
MNNSLLETDKLSEGAPLLNVNDTGVLGPQMKERQICLEASFFFFFFFHGVDSLTILERARSNSEEIK